MAKKDIGVVLALFLIPTCFKARHGGKIMRVIEFVPKRLLSKAMMLAFMKLVFSTVAYSPYM